MKRGQGTPLGAVTLDIIDDRDFYEERAAIIEHMGKLPRREAERIAREREVASRLLRRRLLAVHIASVSE